MIKLNMTRRQSVKALAAGTVAFALSAGMTFAENADVKIGFTPKFLKDDFQTLMLDNRGGRKGFPPAVALELSTLASHYAKVYPYRHSIWDDVIKK